MRRRAILICLLLALLLVLAACTGLSNGTVARMLTAGRLARQVSSYATALLPQISALDQVMGGCIALLQNPRPEAKDWQLLVTAQAGPIDRAYTALSDIKPPAELAELHAAAARAAGDCKQAEDIATAAIGSADKVGLERAAQLGTGCVAQLRTVRADLLAYAQAHDIRLPQERVPENDAPTIAIAAPQPAGGSSSFGSTLNDEADLRSGPGADYTPWATVPKGTAVTVIGRNEAGDWLVVQTEGVPQAWVATLIVDNPPDIRSLPLVRAPPLEE